MSKNLSVEVNDHLAGFIDTQVSEGHYKNAGDVARAGLELLAEQEARLVALRAAILEGEESGISDRNVLEIWEDVKRELDAERG